jgi:hypothetical protein
MSWVRFHVLSYLKSLRWPIVLKSYSAFMVSQLVRDARLRASLYLIYEADHLFTSRNYRPMSIRLMSISRSDVLTTPSLLRSANWAMVGSVSIPSMTLTHN